MSLQTAIDETKAEFPNFKLVKKADSKLMKAIDLFLKIISLGAQDLFLINYATTLGHTIYTQKSWDALTDEHKERIVRHERIHMRQAKKYTPVLYAFLYLFFPLPIGLAWYRAKFEMEAYAETMRCAYEQEGADVLLKPELKVAITKQFLSAKYLWMWPFEESISKWYSSVIKQILS